VIFIDPNEIFKGVTLIVAPHMDDEVLACGGTIAQLPQKERIHVVYATDGMESPAPVLPWRDAISPDLGVVRMREAKAAMECLGVPEKNIHFLGLPDGQLESYRAELNEYFIYYRSRLLPAGDIRQYIHPQHLVAVNIEAVLAQKRAALDCFKSQTTRFYTWQSRPNLTKPLLDEVSRTPEFFLRYNPSFPGAAIFSRAVPWIRFVHRTEPYLKKRKDHVVAVLNRGLHWNGRNT
jgi:LmbE family N-acetylglucosaminyl deacetylase